MHYERFPVDEIVVTALRGKDRHLANALQALVRGHFHETYGPVVFVLLPDNQQQVEPPAPEPLPEDVEQEVEPPLAGGGVGAPAPLPESPLEERPVVEGVNGQPDGEA